MYRHFKNKDEAENSGWFFECQKLGIPYIFITKQQRYFSLHWDCISVCGTKDSALRNDAGTPLSREVFKVFQKTCSREPGKAFFDGSIFVGDIIRMRKEDAEALAGYIYCVVMSVLTPIDQAA